MALRTIKFFIIYLFLNQPIFGQVDTEFWFAAPEVTDTHADRPVYLRISTLQQATLISISVPSNPAFATINKLIAANSTVSINLTDRLDLIENKPANTPLNNGILLQTSSPVTAYYEVLGTNSYGVGVNSDIFVLKGNHALGKEFYTPFQSFWDNSNRTSGYSSFDIVATENNTSVTITPTQDIVGHIAGVSFTITLQKGQTYSAQAISQLAALHLSGSHITSNKPIAVTIKDDSIQDSTNYDLAGDQIIPINFTGKEYIAVKVSGTANTDRLYIVATKPSTSIFIDGNPIAITTLNAGQTFEFQLLNPTAFITSSDSIYVWHIAGFGSELGGAILPPIGCTGSRQVSFTRSTDEEFYIQLVVKSGFESYFKLNGSSALVLASSFTTVPGSSGVWKYAKIPFSPSILPEGSTNLIKNDSSDFHLATLNGGAITGFRYGYFSDFGFLELGSNNSICEGDSLVLDAGFLRDSYLWNTGATSQFITIKDSGSYNVTITKGVCSSSDTVHLAYYPAITTDVLGNDTSACANAGLQIKTLFPFKSYEWSVGFFSISTLFPNNTGKYFIQVTNEFGCKKTDSIFVTIFPVPQPQIVYDTNIETFCKNPFVNLSSSQNFIKYLWSTGDTTNSIVGNHNEKDNYSLLVSDNNNCINNTTLTIDCSPIIGLIPNLLTPNNDGLNDIFYIEYLRPYTWTLEIFNGWGDKVYRNDGYNNNFNSNVLDDGIYYYSFRHNEGKGERKGWLQILR